jgi:hypothetical protein
MIEITRYQSRDGKEFETQEEAKNRELFLDFVDEIEASDIYWRDTNAEEVAEWFWKNYSFQRAVVK